MNSRFLHGTFLMLHRRHFVLASSGLLAASLVPAADTDEVPVSGVEDKKFSAFDEFFRKLITEGKIPGIGVAMTHQGKLVYARGFGLADKDKKAPPAPDSVYRIASLSKVFTATAVMQLVEKGKVKLTDFIVDILKLTPLLAKGDKQDPRWAKVTVRQCLQHTLGLDRDKTPDPVIRPGDVAKLNNNTFPVTQTHVVRYALGMQLDFDPGTKQHYTNVGYLMLGRLIELITKQKYEDYIRKEVLTPMKIVQAKLGRALPENRAKNEVRYYDSLNRESACLYQPRLGKKVPIPDGGDNFEAYEAHGGWIASPVDMVRFLTAFDDREKCPLLSADSIAEMWSPPPGDPGHDKQGKPLPAYYADGWTVISTGEKDKVVCRHTGLMSGTSALLTRRPDKVCWAAFCTTDTTANKQEPSLLIDAAMHQLVAGVKEWPTEDQFGKYLKL